MPEAEPIFVNRRTQLHFFDGVLSALDRGERRHISLLGLRRIGKTMLLDEVRLRHPNRCIPRLPVDVMVSTPEDFALEFLSTVLQSAVNARQIKRTVTTRPTSLTAAAALLGEAIVPSVEEILDLIADSGSYGRLLSKVFAFPSALSDALALPILVILDEFQDVSRLQNFKNTDNLWAVIREALDRRGQVAFVIAGSIVTAMRKLLHAGNDPIFTRFHELELPPFAVQDTQELALGIWERGEMTATQDAVQRLHTLTQGFPFYVHTLALAASEVARTGSSQIAGYHVDAAFQTQLLDRNSTISIYCQYLFEQALGGVRGENIPEAVLRHLAGHEGRTRADMARSVRRSQGAAQVNRIIAELVDIDILTHRESGLWFVDPILPIWIAIERERRDPTAVFLNPEARAKVVRSYEERIATLHQAMGEMFEKRIDNALRQFRGQVVSGRLFGASGQITLPSFADAKSAVLSDPKGVFSGEPGSVEIDSIATGTETWAIEAKHRAGGVTVAKVDRFVQACKFYEQQTGQHIDKLWYLSQTGFRAEARQKCEVEGIYFSILRDLAQLERILAR